MANRLAQESSPYLLQHKDNPVDWYPWSEEALARAREDDKPILLSIGYSACHWCHVMAHESFEDPDTAALINSLFVPVKVDREERPDLDSIYMEAVQRLTGSGGWPMTVFLTPDGRPFFGGTYFPPQPRHGLPGFRMLLSAIGDAYRDRRSDLERDATQIAASLGNQIASPASPEPDLDLVQRAARAIGASHDHQYGGLTGAPKFPQPMAIEVLLRVARHWKPFLQMAEHTLTAMARGGIYDQLGGGFHRYSVDEQWLVPHFEKMLYDNAQLARVYTYAYQVTGNSAYRRVAAGTLRYVQREMTATHGGFFATQDADSDGHEGTFYLWTADQIAALLGPDAPLFMQAYGVTPRGNFEGKNILHVAQDLAALAATSGTDPQALEAVLVRCRATLLEARDRRIHPARDEKIITAWNGLMLRAFATAAAVFDDATFRQTAEANAAFILATMRHDGGRLLHTYKDGRAKLNGYLDDYAFLADALLALYETTGVDRWRLEALALADHIVDRFADPAGGPFYSTSSDHERLIHRPRDLYDNAVPSGNSVAAEVLLRLATHTGDEHYRTLALQAITPLHDSISAAPLGFARLLCAADMATEPARELAIIGDPAAADTRALLRCAHARFDPNLVIGVATPAQAAASTSPMFQGRVQLGGTATAYLCERYVCRRPVTDPDALHELLRPPSAP